MIKKSTWTFCLLVAAATHVVADDRVVPDARYRPVSESLSKFIKEQMEDKKIPGLSIALIDDQRIVWAEGFGHRDAKKTEKATAETVYRVGSVSKLFTDIAVMQHVEKGQLSLDAPITDYLPEFKPRDPFRGPPITLRLLMAHRSGLVREPPIGHYFDPTEPTLTKTIGSLNNTDLVYKTGTRMKYSNAGVATVGYVLEKLWKEPFAEALQKRILEPMGLPHSAFSNKAALRPKLADALMGTWQGREFKAPVFELGESPAGSMESTVLDLGKFMQILLAGGKGILLSSSLDEMFRPQFSSEITHENVGLGFFVTDFDGKRRVGHGGAIYGFATELAFLPDDKLGVVVIASRDCANNVCERIANLTLKSALAARAGQPMPQPTTTRPIPPEDAKRWAGQYRWGTDELTLSEMAGKLYFSSPHSGLRAQLRAADAGFITDDMLDFGSLFQIEGDKLRVRDKLYERVPDTGPPADAPERWRGLIGEYGWDHNTLYILEMDGKLYALIEWYFLYQLSEESVDVHRFPEFGLYHGEKLIFSRGQNGRATKVEAASVVFERRTLVGESGLFKIVPEKPVDELRPIAKAASPPKPQGEVAKSDLVELVNQDPSIRLDIRYASKENFLGTPVYTSAKAFLQRPAAESLVQAHRKLSAKGFGLCIHDGYRPWYVTKIFWDATPRDLRLFVADPSTGSRHNRGCAVDLTLFERSSGAIVPMVSGYDEFADRAFADYPGGTSRQRWHRNLLRTAMESQGFTVFPAEWWHFDFKDWKMYPIVNTPFEELSR